MIIAYQDQRPRLDPACFVEETALVIGDVEIGPDSSVWFSAVIRGDVNFIRIGARTNIQDGCMVHVTLNKWHTVIGSDTTVGHRAVLHGCRVGDHCLIGMGAIVLDGVEVGDYSLIGAGALVPPGMKVPPRSLVVGVPGKVVRELKEADLDMIVKQSKEYEEMARLYAERNGNR